MDLYRVLKASKLWWKSTLLLSVLALAFAAYGHAADSPALTSQEVPRFDVVVTSASDNGFGTALRFSGTTGDFRGVFPVGGGLTDPRDITLDLPDPRNIVNGDVPPFTTVFIVGGNNNVLRFALDGTFLEEFIKPFMATDAAGNTFGLNGGGLVIGPDRNIYVIGRQFRSIIRFDAATGAFIDFFVPVSPAVVFPRGFVFSESGEFLFWGNGADPATGMGGGTIQKYNGRTGELIDANFVNDPGLSPLDVILGLDGNIYTSSEVPFNSPDAVATVRVYSATTGALLRVLDAGLDGQGVPIMQRPRGMGIGPDGRLYVSSSGNERVLRFDLETGRFIDVFIEFPGLNGQALQFIPASPAPTGAVYTMTNAPNGNRVLAFDRGPDGRLSPAGSFATRGRGTGGELRSQGALVLDRTNRWLFAVNGGSDETSVFAVESQGLRFVHKVNSGGAHPISLTVHRNLLYVLNAGGQVGGSDNITGFIVGEGGMLSPLSGSTRLLSAAVTDPSQVQFSPDGNVLVVTEKATNMIDTYIVGTDGLVTDPIGHGSAGMTPFGVAFDTGGRLFVSEAANNDPGAGSMSSYMVSNDGDLQVISPSVGTMQTATCWVVVTNNGGFAYASNTRSGSISGFRIDPDASLSLLNADGRTGVTGDGSFPIDMGLSNDNSFLYTVNTANGTISAFQVEQNGELVPLQTVKELPLGVMGLAAR